MLACDRTRGVIGTVRQSPHRCFRRQQPILQREQRSRRTQYSCCTRVVAQVPWRDDTAGSSRSGSSSTNTTSHRSSSSGRNMSSLDNRPPQQALSFINAHGERLAATLVDVSSPDIVILCHGYAATKDGFHFPRLAAELAARGLSSLRFDFAGNGESEGAFSFGNYYREVEDLRAAVEFARGPLRRRVRAIVGHSKGGNVVLLYASKYDDVPHVINIAGRGVMSRGIKERFGEDILERLAREGPVEQQVRADGGRRTVKYLLTLENVEERMRLDMLAEAAKIGSGSGSSCASATTRVLTVHGDADAVIPVEDAHALAAVVRRHRLVVVPGADHNFRQPAAAEAVIGVVSEYLTGEAAGQGMEAEEGQGQDTTEAEKGTMEVEREGAR